MKSIKLRLMCISGIFTALVFATTAYLQIPTHNGYVHIGDAFIFLAACLLPMRYSLFAASVGATLADVLTGFAIWAPGTFVIKALLAILFTCKTEKIITPRNTLMLIPAAFVLTLGYYLYEVLITSSFVAALSGIPGQLIQSAASSFVFIAAGLAMDKFNVKKIMKVTCR